MTSPKPPTSSLRSGPPSRLARARGATARGERTRERLLDAAERLWGERGVAGVSLREIRLAAGQRNNSALQFHFGGRDGLVRALADRHVPEVEAIRNRLYAGIVAEGRHEDVAALVEVMVRPAAEYLRRGPSERAWVRIVAELAAAPEIRLDDVLDRVPAVALQVGASLHDQLVPRLGPELAVERLLSVLYACGHLCADRARIEDQPPGDDPRPRVRPILPFDAWLDNLLEMAVGALLAGA